MDQRQLLPDIFCREPAALDAGFVIARMLDEPASSASGLASFSSTGIPALAQAMAMPPPMVPAPTMRDAPDREFVDALSSTWHLRSGPFGEESVDQRLGLIGYDALLEDLALAAAAVVETAGRGRFNCLHGAQRRMLMPANASRQSGARLRKGAHWSQASRGCRCAPGSSQSAGLGARRPRRPQEVTIDHCIDQARRSARRRL